MADWEEVMRRRYPAAVRAVDRRLTRRLRRRIDAEDVVMETIGRILLEGRRPEALAAWSVCTLVDAIRAHSAAKRRGEEGWPDVRLDGGRRPLDVAAPAPEPIDVLVAREELARVLDRPYPEGRRLVALLADGWTMVEIAAELGWHRRAVERAVRLIRGPGPVAPRRSPRRGGDRAPSPSPGIRRRAGEVKPRPPDRRYLPA